MTYSLQADFSNRGVTPGKCFACGLHKTGSRENYPVVAVGDQIPYEGYVELCGQCVVQFARDMGITVDEDAAAQRAEAKYEVLLDEERERADTAEAELTTYREVIAEALSSRNHAPEQDEE